MKVVETLAEARLLKGGGGAGVVAGLVPTMGFFHEGHLSLMERAVEECRHVLVSLFVNPLQFNEPSDLDRYPADHDRDLALAEGVGVDVVVVPSVREMYPLEPLTRVTVAGLSDRLEGEHRPGHLEGVATVVTKLFAGLQPDRAYFGRKDAQQLAVVRRLALDLSLPVDVVGCPLIREHDGLALSSRNVFLADDRPQARGLSEGLFAAADVIEAGERSGEAIESAVRDTASEVTFQYVSLVDAETMQPLSTLTGTAVLAVAAAIGPVRLIDNVHIEVIDGDAWVDRGVRIDGPTLMEGRQ